MPELTGRRLRTVPDWICEVLSESTREHDLGTKRDAYARLGVAYWWVIDPQERMLVAHELVDGRWAELGRYEGALKAGVAPFEAVELDLAEWGASGVP